MATVGIHLPKFGGMVIVHPGPYCGSSNRFYLIEANETLAETFYFWYFLLRIDSETLFS